MIEPDSVNEVARWAVPFLVAAVRRFGERVFDRTADNAIDTATDGAAGLGSRLLSKLLHRRAEEPAAVDPVLAEAVEDTIADPDDSVTTAALEARVRKLLASDPSLLQWVVEQRTAAAGNRAIGERSVAAGDISGSIVITGDQNWIQR